MNAEQLRDTTLDKNNRILKQIKITDFESSAYLVNTLMGKDSSKRKEYIVENGHKVNLYI